MKKKIMVLLLIIIIGYIVSYNLKIDETANDEKQVEVQDEYYTVQNHDIVKSLTALGEIESAKTETLKLNTNYSFQTMCAEENEIIKKRF